MTIRRKISLILFLFLLPLTAGLAAPSVNFNVDGVNDDIKSNILSRLQAEHKAIGEQPTPAITDQFIKHSPRIVREAITPFGYFSPLVNMQIHRVQNTQVVTYTVRLGKPVLIKSIDIQIVGPGANNRPLKRFLHHLPLQVGQPFAAAPYTNTKDKLLNLASNQGYLKAEYTDNQVRVNTDTRTAVIIMHLNTGEQYYFGHLIFNKTSYSEEFLQRFDVFPPNRPFSSLRLISYQQQMNDSSYFNQVIVMPDFQHPTPDRHIPIHVSVVPPKAHRYTFGVGYGTFTGPRLTAGILLRRVTDTGQSFDAQVKWSSVLTGVAAKYYIPGQHPLNEQWILGASYQAFSPKNGQSNSRSIMGGYAYKSTHWQITANLNYMLERYSIFNTPQPAENSEVLYPNLNIGYIKADNPITPTNGKSLNLILQGASKNILSSTSFLQGEVKGKYFYTPVSFAHLIFRADIGYTVVQDLNNLPLSLRYFAGGVTSVRGYPDSSIGPGKYLEVASVEYRNKLIGDLDGAVFYDTGLATNHIGDPLNKGIGVGLVYNSLVGPIKLYLARAISKHDRPYQVEFSIGPEF